MITRDETIDKVENVLLEYAGSVITPGGARRTAEEITTAIFAALVTEPHSDATIGDYLSAIGAITHVAANFIDWEKLNDNQPDAVSAPGRILLDAANKLRIYV